MDIIRSVIDNETNKFSYEFGYPVSSPESSQATTNTMVKSLGEHVVRELSGFETLIERVLEYDAKSYTVTVTGTPILVTVLGGEALGYKVTLQILPRTISI